MSTYEGRKALKANVFDKKMTSIKETASLRYRHKRPDKQLYVPRALRKADTKNDVEKDARNQSTCVINKVKKQNDEPMMPKYNPNDVGTNLNSSGADDILSVKPCDESSLQIIENSVLLNCAAEENSEVVIKNELHTSDSTQIHSDLKESKSNEDLANAPNDNKNSEATNISINNVKSSEVNHETLHNSTESINQPISIMQVNEELSENPEDSWETMFNDDGDCLDPKLIKKLCDITGQIDLAVVKRDYSSYQPVSKNSAEDFENIVELYGFPTQFKSQDLTSAFSSFQEDSYNIKWVDDCHALAIFSSPAIASQALLLSHPFIKVRPVSEGIKESKEKARFCAKMFETRRPRPVTSAALARRLVSGALGLKVNASKEQREIERNMLKEAKEKKKLKARQQQDIWNGIVT